MEYKYEDWHILTAICFPPEERRKIIRVESWCSEGPLIWVTSEPLREETIRKLELKEVK